MRLKTGMELTDNIIRELILSQTVNALESSTGIDSLEHCKDSARFRTYHKLILYQYNYMGYRDEEWPDNLDNQLWCIGDSFTVGLGQPSDETWSNILSQKMNRRIINVSMNGASNDWIARRAKFILENLNPEAILIQWSYLHRREVDDSSLLDEERALWHSTDSVNDLKNFLDNINSIEKIKKSTKIIHSFIPEFSNPNSNDAESIYFEMRKINALGFPPREQVDYSRDGHHYDVATATAYAEKYFEILHQLQLE